MEKTNNQKVSTPLPAGREGYGGETFAFDRMNYILIAIGMAVVIIGFILMAAVGSSEESFNPAIFSDLHIKVAPAVTFFGFIFIIYGIMHKPKSR
jgi:uncharacterized membrane protein